MRARVRACARASPQIHKETTERKMDVMDLKSSEINVPTEPERRQTEHVTTSRIHSFLLFFIYLSIYLFLTHLVFS